MLHDLYDAIEDDGALAQFAATVADLCGARSANVVYVAPDAPAFQQLSYWPAEYIPLYLQRFVEKDPWRRQALIMGIRDRAVSMDDYIPPESFVETEMFNELLQPLGDDTGRCMGIEGVRRGAHLHIAVHRPARGAAFSAADKRRLEETFGHAARVMYLRMSLEGERSLRQRAESMIAAADVAVLIVDAALKVLTASDAAARIIDDADGISLRNGRLAIARLETADLLRRTVSELVEREPVRRPALLCARPSGRPSYRLFLSLAGCGSGAGVALIIDDPCSTSRSRKLSLLAEAYRLTRAELLLVQGLMDGSSLDAIAAARNVSVETVRTQLKSVFAKTGTNRQIDLVALLS
jgi:DNA-binding CsgD family transcriptional regulator